jgi:hypothetical protein
MKKAVFVFLFASSLVAQVQIGKGVQIGSATGGGAVTPATTSLLKGTGVANGVASAGASDVVSLFPGTGPCFLKSDGTCAVGGGLTSFTTGNLAPLFTVSLGANPTTAPVQTFTLSSTSQNFFMAGPTGGAGVPTYRLIVPGDIPTLNQSTTGNAATATLAANSSAVGGVALTGLCQTGGTGCPAGGSGLSGQTAGYAVEAATATTATGPFPMDDSVTNANTVTVHKALVVNDGTGNPGCISLSASQICITSPPYNASTFGLTTTTTSVTFGVGTSGAVASCSTFLANQGVLITGAGPSGANYIGTVVTCSGTTLTVTPATSTSVASGIVVQHDETAAFLAAFAAIAASSQLSGTIQGPDGVYLVNGPLLDTSGANAILPMPKLANYVGGTVDISIKGFTLPNWDGNAAGMIIKTSAMTGNLFGGYDNATGGGFPNFTNVKLEMEKVSIQAPINTGAVMINASNLQAFQGKHILCNAPGSGTTIPTNTAGGCIFMPQIGNEVQNQLDDIQAGNLYTSYKLTEHTHAGSIYAVYAHNCFVFDNGNTSTSVSDYKGNGAQIDYLWEQNCVNGIVGGAGPFHSPLNISLADLENTTGNGVLDSSNTLYGIINIQIPSTVGGALSPCNANALGGLHLAIHYINCQPDSSASGGSGPPSGLIENWISQEGLGTMLVNSGADFMNAMTTSNVTWATAAGFAGNVATYNGSTSTATASSFSGTNFTGAAPFSICQWLTPSSLAGISNEILLSNTSSTTGISVQLFGSSSTVPGSYQVNLYNTLANFIQTRTASATIPVGSASLACFTYDATGVAAGVKMYINGVAAAATVGSDTLSGGSIASGVAMHIGSGGGPSFLGAIGRVRIFNRLLSSSEIVAMTVAGPNAY